MRYLSGVTGTHGFSLRSLQGPVVFDSTAFPAIRSNVWLAIIVILAAHCEVVYNLALILRGTSEPVLGLGWCPVYFREV